MAHKYCNSIEKLLRFFLILIVTHVQKHILYKTGFNPTLVLAILLLSVYYATAQQNLSFRKYQEEDGLSNGFVTSIYQDKRGFLWLATANGLNRFDGYNFHIFNFDQNDSTSLSHQTIWAIGEDTENKLWFGTMEGLNQFDPSTQSFTRFLHDRSNLTSLSSNHIESIACDKYGDIWVGTDKGINRKKRGSKTFQRFWYIPDSLRAVKSIIQTQDSNLWVGSKDTLFQFDYRREQFLPYPLPSSVDQDANEIRLVYEDEQGYLWVGTQSNGAFRFDPRLQLFTEHLVNIPNNPNSLSHNRVSAFAELNRKLWIGTYGGGLNVWDPASREMTRYVPDPLKPAAVNSETIRAILKDNTGNLWLGTFYDGLYQFKATQDQFLNFSQASGLSAKTVNDITVDQDDQVWLAMADGGLGKFDGREKRFVSFLTHDANDPNSLPNNDIRGVMVDNNGRILLALAADGLCRYDPTDQIFHTLVPPTEKGTNECIKWLEHLLPTDNGDIWLGTQEGLCKFSQADGKVYSYPLPTTSKTDIEHEENTYVTDLLQDHKNQLWVSTNGGLNLYHEKVDTFSFYPYPHQILAISEDSEGTLWLGTVEGLAKFDFASKKIIEAGYSNAYQKSINAPIEDHHGRLWYGMGGEGIQRLNPGTGGLVFYNKKDGIVGNHFWTSTKTTDGFLYFGGTEGFLIFHPDSLRDERNIPPIVLTGFKLFNKEVPIRGSPADTMDGPSPLIHSITEVEAVELRHWENYFSLEFSALDFTAPENNLYRYQLKGYDEDWIETNAQRRLITYTNLDPGTYTFRVQGAVPNGAWSEDLEASLDITILTPLWQTWWAYLLYSTLLFVVISTFYRFQLHRRIAENEAHRLKELDVEKNRLFANVSHEFRTPLTVILGMAGKIQEDPAKWQTKGLESITRNGHRVLHLVNQMLDLSRLEIGRLQLEMQQGDVVLFINYLVQSYESFAETKEIHLVLRQEVPSLIMDYSSDALSKIIGNLLSNALKFTPKKGKVEVIISSVEDQLQLEVHDNGTGIAVEHLPYIFNRFYQVDESNTRRSEGTGIGLALVKELVNHLEGQIQVDSDGRTGTKFQVRLPIKRQAEVSSQLEMESKPNFIETGSRSGTIFSTQELSDLPQVLVIEDNEDVAEYIGSCLSGRYQVQFAENGRIGLEKALNLVPDLIICDVMMPEMDGYEVCRRLKQANSASHIPIVMLTAKADIASRLQGLRQGADAYLAKPFHPEELELRLINLLQLKEQIQSYFRQFPSGLLPKQAFPQEREFLKRIRETLLIHLAEEDFGIPELCQALGISRSQLHRKLKALTGKSTSMIVRLIRLEQARNLLMGSDLNISEVAYQTGFSNPNYFSTVFSETFGISPKEMRGNSSMQQ